MGEMRACRKGSLRTDRHYYFPLSSASYTLAINLDIIVHMLRMIMFRGSQEAAHGRGSTIDKITGDYTSALSPLPWVSHLLHICICLRCSWDSSSATVSKFYSRYSCGETCLSLGHASIISTLNFQNLFSTEYVMNQLFDFSRPGTKNWLLTTLNR